MHHVSGVTVYFWPTWLARGECCYCRLSEHRQGTSFSKTSHTGSGTHPASSVGAGVTLTRKAAGVWCWPVTSNYCLGLEWVEFKEYAFMKCMGTNSPVYLSLVWGYARIRLKKGKDKVVPVPVMNAYRGSGVTAPLILKLGNNGGGESTSRLDPLPSGKNSGPHRIGSCENPRAGLKVFAKSSGRSRDSNPGALSPLRSHCTELLRLLKFVWCPNL
jgi:hypothetical protein